MHTPRNGRLAEAARWLSQWLGEGDSWLLRTITQLGFDEEQAASPHAALFTAHDKVLHLVAVGLAGTPVTLKAARPKDVAPYSDGATIFLPPSVSVFDDADENFQLLKMMMVLQLLHITHGSYSAAGQFATFAQPALAEDIYALIEQTRIERLLAQEYRGLARGLAAVQDRESASRLQMRRATEQTQFVEQLVSWSFGRHGASEPGKVADSMREAVLVLEETLAGDAGPIDSLRVATYLVNRIERLQGPYVDVQHVGYRGKLRMDLVAPIPHHTPSVTALRPPDDTVIEHIDESSALLKTRMADDLNMAPSKVVVRESIRAAGVAGQESDDHAIWLDVAPRRVTAEVELTPAERQGAFVYDEWDFERQMMRPRWCALRERDVLPGNARYVDSVLSKHRALVTNIKRQFDTLRPEYRRLRKQADGEEIDLDSVVEAFADLMAGTAPQENLYISRQANRRDIGVAFLVDLSGSAGGWVGNSRIIDIERESLILICEALQMLNDRYAIYGFSSSTRKQCDLYRIKEFGETYNNDIKLRISGLEAFSYTRMGPPVRHLSKKLDSLDARIKLLMLLTDGKPNDFDGYSGRYAVEDTRRALLEARLHGIKTYCLTIDSRAREYLPAMFGENGYSILDDVERLPAKLPDLYRRLTGR